MRLSFTNNIPLEEMAQVGYVDKYEIAVFTRDAGYIPHFHFRDLATLGQKFNSCIRLDKPEYFQHEGKDDTLNSKQRKALYDFMKSPSKNKRYKTNYEYAVSMWNDNNSAINIPEDGEIPDYRELR